MRKIFEKRLFFRADMAGLGKYHMGGCGRIGVYRVNSTVSFRHSDDHHGDVDPRSDGELRHQTRSGTLVGRPGGKRTFCFLCSFANFVSIFGNIIISREQLGILSIIGKHP